jgi:hypothetical protein
MFCPLCGAKLIEIQAPEQLTDAGLPERDESTHFKCDNCKSFGEGYPLVMHHPFGGLKSSPGDSWSLSWVK